MADPLSAAASITVILYITAKLVLLGNDYIKGIKEAPEDIQQLVDELQSLNKVLSILGTFVLDDKNLQSTALQALRG